MAEPTNELAEKYTERIMSVFMKSQIITKEQRERIMDVIEDCVTAARLQGAREQQEKDLKQRNEDGYVCVSGIRLVGEKDALAVYALVDGKEYRVIGEKTYETLPINHNVTADGIITVIREEPL